MLEYLQMLDTKWFLFLNGLHNPLWDKIMWYISATLTWIPLYVLIVAFAFKKFGRNAWLSLIFFGLLVLLSDQASVNLFKNVFERLRPCHNVAIQDLVHTVNGKCGGQFGFVSSHATNTFALAIFLVFFFKNKLVSISIILWAIVVSYSRIYLGVHYVFDVVGGALLGCFIGFIIAKAYSASLTYLQKRKVLINRR